MYVVFKNKLQDMLGCSSYLENMVSHLGISHLFSNTKHFQQPCLDDVCCLLHCFPFLPEDLNLLLVSVRIL